jgi:hypothetical protein
MVLQIVLLSEMTLVILDWPARLLNPSSSYKHPPTESVLILHPPLQLLMLLGAVDLVAK